MITKSSFTALLFLLSLVAHSQSDTLRVLYLGNSYTNANNLAQITQSLAAVAQKTLVTDKNTPGGHTLDEHSTNTTSLNKIRAGQWDFVVLQEQSQVPTIDYYRYNLMYPAALRLNDSIKKYNACAQVVLYMTWGRRYGGQQCDPSGTNCSPVFVDFSHMQDSLKSAYTTIADSINAYISPAGLAWQKVLNDTAIVLHTADNSHPNYSGSYLTACVFHSIFWNESAAGLAFTGSLSAGLATYLQQAADSTVFPYYAAKNRAINDVVANFTSTTFVDSVQFTNLSKHLSPATYFWDFGDGTSSTAQNPYHVYGANQNYTVSLRVNYCQEADTVSQQISINGIGLSQNDFGASVSAFPNPFTSGLELTVPNSTRQLKVEIVNYTGAVVASYFLNNEFYIKLDLGYLKNGLYLLQLTDKTQNKSATLRILKK